MVSEKGGKFLGTRLRDKVVLDSASVSVFVCPGNAKRIQKIVIRIVTIRQREHYGYLRKEFGYIESIGCAACRCFLVQQVQNFSTAEILRMKSLHKDD